MKPIKKMENGAEIRRFDPAIGDDMGESITDACQDWANTK